MACLVQVGIIHAYLPYFVRLFQQDNVGKKGVYLACYTKPNFRNFSNFALEAFVVSFLAFFYSTILVWPPYRLRVDDKLFRGLSFGYRLLFKQTNMNPFKHLGYHLLSFFIKGPSYQCPIYSFSHIILTFILHKIELSLGKSTCFSLE